ncbi:hypothetical protein D8890_09325 [Streptococcus sanguinis]|uniref:hypothetical protein n=1 Tax=Streptococcus sanguinis TaxID=1305 RepID=UPI000F9B8F44|nr:hypothetical protein [Streptococcus sanguinis]RSI03319.1 hypothetical protein D8890_09325 [Streptococcus sanguinis]
MDGCLSPIDGTGYTDGQHVDIAMFEYAEDITVGKKAKVGDVGYRGTVSQIYDNVHGNEEQYFIFTNFYQ